MVEGCARGGLKIVGASCLAPELNLDGTSDWLGRIPEAVSLVLAQVDGLAAQGVPSVQDPVSPAGDANGDESPPQAEVVKSLPHSVFGILL